MICRTWRRNRLEAEIRRPSILPLILMAYAAPLLGQEVRTDKENPLTLSGYAEAYYIGDFNGPPVHRRPGFAYSHNRTDEASVNLALMRLGYDTERVRAGLGIALGSYMKANYAAEPGGLKNLFEARVGLRVAENHNVWVDVGVMPSHIGFESAVGKDNWTLTRSLLADNSPYFETGARISYTSPDGKWLVSGLILNGWQRIRGPAGNSLPSFGHQVTYRPNERWTLNSSSFIGSDKSDEHRQMRYFHNFHAQFHLSSEWSLIAAFDIGAEQKEKGSSRYNVWFTPIAIARYAPTEKLSFALRGEYYQDRHGVIVGTGTPHGFRMLSYSLNMDYRILPNLLWRAEVRRFEGRDAIFATDDGTLTSDSTMATTALAISF